VTRNVYGFSSLQEMRERKKETKPRQAPLEIIFSFTVILERLLYFFDNVFSPFLWFLGFEMVLDSPQVSMFESRFVSKPLRWG
jgi:hypothetical protein